MNGRWGSQQLAFLVSGFQDHFLYVPSGWYLNDPKLTSSWIIVRIHPSVVKEAPATMCAGTCNPRPQEAKAKGSPVWGQLWQDSVSKPKAGAGEIAQQCPALVMSSAHNHQLQGSLTSSLHVYLHSHARSHQTCRHTHNVKWRVCCWKKCLRPGPSASPL